MPDGLKTGANKMDVAQIQKLDAAGVDAKEISLKLRIKIECVKSFMAKPKKTTKAKTKATKEK